MKIKIKSLLIICCSVFLTFAVINDANASESKVRIGGKDRYQTAIQISKAGWVDKSKSVVLATGQDLMPYQYPLLQHKRECLFYLLGKTTYLVV
nr:cell wall-binding repeat-containing protein [Clostridium bowmanii]